jgi:phosphohistidine phosphatase
VTVRRRLLLLRHAKSSWDDPLLDDHDRPLAPRGHKALKALRAELAAAAHPPEVVICSSARRTVQTLDGVREVLPSSTSVLVDDALYLASAEELLASVHQIPAVVRTAMLVAHNPGLEDLAGLLIGAGDEALRRELGIKFPTGVLVSMSFTDPWADLAPGGARLDDVFFPRRRG